MPSAFRRLESASDEEVILRTESNKLGFQCCGRKIQLKYIAPIVILTIIVLALSIALAAVKVKHIDHYKEVHADDHLICNTVDCLTASGEILVQMNLSVDPCQDFFQYACGNFIAKQFLEPSERKVGHFDTISKDNNKILYKGLTSENDKLFGTTSKALLKAKKLHQQCMDVMQLQKARDVLLVDLLDKLLGFHSEVTPAANSSWSFQDALVKLNQYDLFPFFSVMVGPDDKNSTLNVVMINQHGLTLDSKKDYNMSFSATETQKKKDAMIKYGKEVLNLLNYGNDTEAIMKEIYELEKLLADIFIPPTIIRDPTISYHNMSLGDFGRVFKSYTNITNHLSQVLDRNFSDDYVVVTYTYKYFEKLTSILDNYLNNTNGKRIVKNYLAWYVIHHTIGYLSAEFQYAGLILSNATEGIRSIEDRWKICTRTVDHLMDRVTGSLFIEGRFGPKDRDAVIEMVNDIKVTLTHRFLLYTWMDKPTARVAIDKANSIKTMIGYPDYITNTTDIDNYYRKFNVSQAYFDTMVNYRQWTVLKMADKLNHPVDPKIWQMSVPAVNAYYNPSHNEIVFPAGILRRPFYDTLLPLAWNYGGMGSVVGHEISHGFDDQGSEYNKHGNLVNWWSNSSRESFDNASKCFVDQYSRYKVGNKTLNGKLNLGENIADNGGLSLAYQAYKSRLHTDNLDAMRLPGMNFTDSQLFFLSYAQLWCVHMTPEYALSNINYNPHSPGQFRVRGTLSNSKEFSEAFNCKAGDNYNPTTKCKVW